MRRSLISVLLVLTFSALLGTLYQVDAQSPEQPPVIIKAIAPIYPPEALNAAKPPIVKGYANIEVQINAQGIVTSVRSLGGPSPLHKAAESAARRWVFAPASKQNEMRMVRLQFKFELVDEKAPDEELSSIFMPPYHIEVRARTPTIDLRVTSIEPVLKSR